MKNHSYISMQQDMPDQGQLDVYKRQQKRKKLGMKLRKCAVICADSEGKTGSDLSCSNF